MILIGAWAFHWKSHYSGAQLYRLLIILITMLSYLLNC